MLSAERFLRSGQKGSSGALAGGGPIRTMRGVPALVTVTFHPADRAYLRDRDGLVLLGWRGAGGRDGGDWLRSVPGQPYAAAAAPVGLPPGRARGSCRPVTARPRQPRAASGRSFPPLMVRLVARTLRGARPGRQAWRAGGAPLKKKRRESCHSHYQGRSPLLIGPRLLAVQLVRLWLLAPWLSASQEFGELGR